MSSNKAPLPDDISDFGDEINPDPHAHDDGVGMDLPPISPMKPHNRRIPDVRGGHIKGAKPSTRFELDYSFKVNLRKQPEPWRGRGYNGADDVIAQIVFERTYQRNGESYANMIIRVVEGVYNIQMRHFMNMNLPWSFRRAQKSAHEMATLMFNMKFLPPGRGLWAMGTPIIEARGLYASLQNCAFVTTGRVDHAPTEPFEFTMDLSMLGVGVGFDTEGTHRHVAIHQPSGHPDRAGSFDIYVVEDSRDGWVYSLRLLLNSYFRPKQRTVQFDYSDIRQVGTPLRGFGGVSSGPEPLMRMHESIRAKLSSYAAEGKYLDTRLITDIMNLIGVCVVSGNIRRSAEIAFGSPSDEVFLDLKNYKKNPDRAGYGWTSNNSVLATVGCDYTNIVSRIRDNGEPGIGWIDNMQRFGRMCDPETDVDKDIRGANPCMEMGLHPFELCNLVETFPHNHKTYAEFKKTLKYAFIYAKSVTLAPIHRPESNRAMMRNRRIGTSMTGISQFVANRGLVELRNWCDNGYKYMKHYDTHISKIFGIPESVKITTVKPSGTVSLLAGATPGVHFPVAQHYIRRIKLSANAKMVDKLKSAGYPVEPSIMYKDSASGKFVYDETTVCVAVPVSLGPSVTKTEANVSMWEQLEMAAFMQHYWADNQVSCTIKFDPKTEGPAIQTALEHYQFRLKGISFLPKGELLDYPQLPYEPITYEKFLELSKDLKPLGTCESTGVQTRKKMGPADCCANVSAPSIPNYVPALSEDSKTEDTEDDDSSEDIESLMPEAPSEISFCEGDSCEISAVRSTWAKGKQ